MSLYKIALNLLVFSGVWHFPLEARKKKKEKPQKPSLVVRPEAITNFNSGDGLGGQFIHVITAAMYAELHAKEFFYSPLVSMEHNYDKDSEFIAKKEKLLNLIGNIQTIRDEKTKNYRLKTDNYLVNFFNVNVAQCAETVALKNLKKFFRANKNRRDYFDDDHLHIAIHVRRLNSHDSRIYGTDVPDDFYLKIIDRLRKKYCQYNILFHIYSQGDRDNFKIYHADDTMLHINESVEDTYTSLVLADVLVTGRSSFSYTAGYLSEGVVYYISYMHSALPHWTPIEKLWENESENDVK